MPLPINLKGEESQSNNPMRQIVEGALGNPLILDAAPTTALGQLKSSQLGFYSGNLYINIAGNTYRISLTLV